MVNPYSYTSRKPYTLSRAGSLASKPLLNPQGMEHIAPRKTSSRFASLGTTARRIVSGPKRPKQHLSMPPPVSSRDHWYGQTIEITASPRHPPPDMEKCATCPFRAAHLDPDHRVRTKLSRGQIGSFKRPSVPPKSPRHRARRAHGSRSFVRLAEAPRSTSNSSIRGGGEPPSRPAPSPSPARTRLSSLPAVVRKYAPSCVTAIEEEQRLPPCPPSTSRSLPSRLPSALLDRPLPPLPAPLTHRKPVPNASDALQSTQSDAQPEPEGPPEADKPVQKTVMFDFAPLTGFTPGPILSSSPDSVYSVRSSQGARKGTPVPSFIKIGNQKLGDFENGKSLYDELREVLGLRGLCLTRADLTWDVFTPSPSPRVSEASLPLTPLDEILADPPSPEILVDVSIDLDAPSTTRPSRTPPTDKTLRRFATMAFEDQFKEVFDAIGSPTTSDPPPQSGAHGSEPHHPIEQGSVPQSSSPLYDQAPEPRTPRRSTLLHVSSLRAQVGTTSPQPNGPNAKRRDEPLPATRWPNKQESTRFVSSGLHAPIRKQRVPSGPRALSGMSSDEWLMKKEIKRGTTDVRQTTRDVGPEDAGPSRLFTTPVSHRIPVAELGRILSQEPLANSAELSIHGRALMREARRNKHREV